MGGVILNREMFNHLYHRKMEIVDTEVILN